MIPAVPVRIRSVALLLANAEHVVSSAACKADASRLWWFDPGSGRFTRAGRLPRPLADSAAFADGTTGYLVGGETPAFSDRVLRLRRE